MSEVLAVIPARGGSKGVPGKNIRPLAGRPLLAYSCAAAQGSRHVTRTVVSTEDEAIARCAVAFGADVPFLRPAALASDETPMLAVLQDLLRQLSERDSYRPGTLVLLQPTSPLRTAAHVDAAIDRLVESGADAVVSVVEVPHAFNPVSVMALEGDRLVPFGGRGTGPTRRQDKPRVFARNGPAVLAVRAAIVEAGSLYGDDCRPLLMTPQESIDIDTLWDFELAEWVLSRRDGIA